MKYTVLLEYREGVHAPAVPSSLPHTVEIEAESQQEATIMVLAQYHLASDELESIVVLAHCPVCARPVPDDDRLEWEGQEYHRACFDEVVKAEVRMSTEDFDD